MATMPRVREIEDLCRKAQMDPRITQVLCMLAERQRVQHQQLMGLAQLFSKMQDVLTTTLEKVGIRDEHLRMLGVEEMLKERHRKDVTVESVEEFDADTAPSNTLDQGKN